MSKLFTQEQIRAWLRENNLRDEASIKRAFVAEIKDDLQEVLEEEMTKEPRYSRYDWKKKSSDYSRNGHSKKTVRSQFGEIDLKVPRDVKSEFEPVIVKKLERTISSQLENMIVSLFACGMSNREIYDQMRSLYGVDVSPVMVSRITDKILPLAKEW